ncbi:MAG: OsmC family peroxiredoxin, partial [Planctomycetaceae bacterium]
MEQQAGQPKVKHKVFNFRTQLAWAGGKAGMLRAEGKPELRIASPPEFKGEAGVWTPEDLFVAALETCTMCTFASFAQRLQLPIVSYESTAEGVLEFVDGGYQFTRVYIRPRVVVSQPDKSDQVRKTLEDAHHACLVAR